MVEKTVCAECLEHKKEDKEKKPSKITVSDVGLIMSIMTFLFVISGIILE